jgi:HAD superfamily hydrolase (TIGR01509 family)
LSKRLQETGPASGAKDAHYAGFTALFAAWGTILRRIRMFASFPDIKPINAKENNMAEPGSSKPRSSTATARPDQGAMPRRPAFLFDLDGTLVDSVYQHVLAWREAMAGVGIELAVWTIHRRIGMSGGLMANAILRETGHAVTVDECGRLLRLHAEAYARLAAQVRPLPGARDLLAYLSQAGVPWAIATSGRLESARPTLEALGVPSGVPIVTRDQVEHAKPDPDLFLAAAQRLGVPIADSVVVGDSVWDLLAARRARALGVGLLSGGYGQDELERAGAYRVYQDPADLLRHLDEIGVRAAE